MKNVIVCIAKDEDHYIDEWITYHLALGFDQIYVYENNWRYAGDKTAYGDRVWWTPYDGEAMQMSAYNDFIRRSVSYNDISYAGFIDCDEFLCLKKYDNAKQFCQAYSNEYGIAVNWRCFGDSGLCDIIDGDYRVLERFVKCGRNLNEHVKTFLNMQKVKALPCLFVNPHFIDLSMRTDLVVDLNGRPVRGPWNFNCTTDIAQLNHYTCKTFSEFSRKFSRGKADTRKSHPQYNYVASDFNKHNENDIIDVSARDFMRKFV